MSHSGQKTAQTGLVAIRWGGIRPIICNPYEGNHIMKNTLGAASFVLVAGVTMVTGALADSNNSGSGYYVDPAVQSNMAHYAEIITGACNSDAVLPNITSPYSSFLPTNRCIVTVQGQLKKFGPYVPAIIEYAVGNTAMQRG